MTANRRGLKAHKLRLLRKRYAEALAWFSHTVDELEDKLDAEAIKAGDGEPFTEWTSTSDTERD